MQPRVSTIDNPADAQPFSQSTYPLGNEHNLHLDKALAIADSIEDEELISGLDLGK